MMRMEPTGVEENTLAYLSEILNTSLTLVEMVKDARGSEQVKIQVGMSELFSLYHTGKMYYFLSCKEEREVDVLHFFTIFDELYFELKHFYFYESNPLRRDFRKVVKQRDKLVEVFERLVDKFGQ
ncbi:hypothetical protein SAMN02745116_00714 [Pilibacter termitis]|uniref:Uncharacterized protein n=1 Tax=Pilibacter termitis TaxID=263852 RepID=A0A1T4LLL4_9ENTE|nr:hypothetical protein [Pilibacter termitis]SJZ55620.1 hypothetical protein SAMN02745116_00714 [Pilibacter termitis]